MRLAEKCCVKIIACPKPQVAATSNLSSEYSCKERDADWLVAGIQKFQEFGDVSGSRIRVRESFQKRSWFLPRDRFMRGSARGPGIAIFARARMNGFNASAFRN